MSPVVTGDKSYNEVCACNEVCAYNEVIEPYNQLDAYM